MLIEYYIKIYDCKKQEKNLKFDDLLKKHNKISLFLIKTQHFNKKHYKLKKNKEIMWKNGIILK